MLPTKLALPFRQVKDRINLPNSKKHLKFKLATSRHLVILGRSTRNSEKKIGDKRGERKRKEGLWVNLIKGCSGIPGSGIPSAWSISTQNVKPRWLLTRGGCLGELKVVGQNFASS